MSQPPKRILFVCIENSNRSQMAEALARMRGGSSVEAYSAGSRPSGRVSPKAVAALREVGYDLSTHVSKSIDELPDVPFDAVVAMGCGDACPFIPATRHIEWDIPDPRDMSPAEVREVRDLIATRVELLLAEL